MVEFQVSWTAYNGGSEGYALRAGPDGEGYVLDIGAGDVFALVGEDACSYAEFGVGAWRRLVSLARAVGGMLGLQYAADLADMAFVERVCSSCADRDMVWWLG